MAYISLEGLTKRYGDHVAVEALELAVDKGEFISLLGPSGCGKTTTLQMIAGFVEPTAGRVMLDGAELNKVKPNRRGLGIVFQSYALFPHMTAAENVAFGLEMRDVSRAERDRRVAEALALVGLAGYADRYPKRMSGGQQQRVALARALVIKPSILLLDEPLSNLDAKLREEMQIELRSIQRSIGTTTILVTHDQSEAMALSDRIVVMNKGRVEQVARPDDAYARPASAFVANFLGKTNLLAGAVEQDADGPVVTVGGLRSPAPAGAVPGPHIIAVRPERLSLTSGPGISGSVKIRVFQGLHWLLQIDTEAGPVTHVRPNDGSPIPTEGQRVTLTFAAGDAAILPAGGAS
ncbi:ABC transporter ATP-binding protein [Alsobacter sp. KACC 23698]|uniref:ABC transporter ATP-binding protein n=1 Tax=Alsobacter sp. KACC 23698 TaxID=3149229 RepID=A0AAU7JJU2_9HYPH